MGQCCSSTLVISHQHSDQVKAYLDRMHTEEDITPVAAEAFEVVEEDGTTAETTG